MSEFPLGYEKIAPVTWAYLSSLLMLGLFFKFSRFWSVRNFDLILLILLCPGLLMVHFGSEHRQLAQTGATGVVSPETDAGGVPAEDSATVPGDRAMIPRPETGIPGRETAIAGSAGRSEPVEGENRIRPSNPPPVTLTYLNQSSAAPNAASVQDNGSNAATSAAPDAKADAELSPEVLAAIRLERQGYVWLFAIGLLFLIRMLIDPMMIRRPLLEPNLSSGGLSFMCVAMLVFLMANIVTSKPTADDLYGPVSAQHLVQMRVDPNEQEQWHKHGPGYALLHVLPVIPTFVESGVAGDIPDERVSSPRNVAVAKTMAILSQMAIVIGIVLIGYRHFGNYQMGIGVAMLYLMLPYTAQMTGRIMHVLPAALIVWALVAYRRPLLAGLFIGLAMGVCYYPIFMLPLWMSFYWRRGLGRFGFGVASMVIVLGISLAFVSSDFGHYVENLRTMFGIWLPRRSGLQGIWSLGWDAIYRLPILAGFVVISFSFAFWPAQKNLGSLLSCSAAVMIAVQFWHGFGGGLYMAWYLPLTLLTFFRPNLEDRVAITVLKESWFQRRHRPVDTKTAA